MTNSFERKAFRGGRALRSDSLVSIELLIKSFIFSAPLFLGRLYGQGIAIEVCVFLPDAADVSTEAIISFAEQELGIDGHGCSVVSLPHAVPQRRRRPSCDALRKALKPGMVSKILQSLPRYVAHLLNLFHTEHAAASPHVCARETWLPGLSLASFATHLLCREVSK